MKIKDQTDADKFAVVAGFNLGWSSKLCTLSLCFEGKEVKLNQEECDELQRVLSGKCHKILAFRNKDEYSAHSAIFTSSTDNNSGELTIYTEDSIAKF
jgi:hypothetical protein